MNEQLSQNMQPMMSKPPPTHVPVQPQLMAQPNPNQFMFVAKRSYNKPWAPQQQQMDHHPSKKKFQNPNNKFKKKNSWKGKNVIKQMPMQIPNMPLVINNSNNNKAVVASMAGGGYQPPSLNDLQAQNRMKSRKYYHPKKKFNNNGNSNTNTNNNNNIGANRNVNRFKPYAPRNTTSFIIRAKKAGGIAEMVSPCPVTPAVLPTPIFSPSREVLGDMAKEEWGVDGYGSMKGLIRLRSPPGGGVNEGAEGEDEDEEGNGSSESDVEEHVEVERRLDHDLSRFEMIYPSYYSGGAGGGEFGYSGYNNVLENRVDDQDSHIAQLEDENLTLKERLFLMERELGDLRRRLQFLERQQFGGVGGGQARDDINEEVEESLSENDGNESDGGSDVGHGVQNNGREGLMEYNGGDAGDGDASKEERFGDKMEVVERDGMGMVNCEVKDDKGGSGIRTSSNEAIVGGGGKLDRAVADDKVDQVMAVDVALEEVITNPLKVMLLHDTNAQMELILDGGVVEKSGSKDGDVCSEKSIDGGDSSNCPPLM